MLTKHYCNFIGAAVGVGMNIKYKVLGSNESDLICRNKMFMKNMEVPAIYRNICSDHKSLNMQISLELKKCLVSFVL